MFPAFIFSPANFKLYFLIICVYFNNLFLIAPGTKQNKQIIPNTPKETFLGMCFCLNQMKMMRVTRVAK